MKENIIAAQTSERCHELETLATKAYDAGHRKQWKMLCWRSQKLSTTGVEPTEEEAMAAFQ